MGRALSGAVDSGNLAAVVIVVLSGLFLASVAITVYFWKRKESNTTDRIKDLESKQNLSSDKLVLVSQQLELISNRLQGGTDSFRDMREAQKQTTALLMQIVTDYPTKKEFHSYCTEHKDTHRGLDKRVTEIRDGWMDLKQEVSKIGDRVQGGLKAITDIVAKNTTIGVS